MLYVRVSYIYYILCAVYISSKASKIKTVKLSSGHDMPIIGFGTWQMPATAIDVAVTTALEIGYRHIDTAFTYGNEEAIGKVLKKWFDKGGKREDIFITTKLPPYGMQPSMIKSYLKLSLEKLNLQYVNMYLIHKPFAFVKDKYKYEAAKYENGSVMLDLEANHLLIWKEMEKLVKDGLTRSIGLSNFNESQLLNIYHNSEIKPSNLQIELQAYNQQRPMRTLCAEYSITVTAFSTLGSPGSSGDKKTKLSQSLPRLLDNPKVSLIAERHNRTAAQVLLRHAVQNGIVVLPKSTHPERIKRNIEIFDFSLTDAEIEELNNLDKGERGRIFHFLGDKGVEKHPQYPFASQLKYENVSVNVHYKSLFL